MKLETKQTITISLEVDQFSCDHCGRIAVGQVALAHNGITHEIMTAVGPYKWCHHHPTENVHADLCPDCEGELGALNAAFMSGAVEFEKAQERKRDARH